MKYLTLVLCALVGSLSAAAEVDPSEQQRVIAERAPFTSKFDGRQDPSSVPEYLVWTIFFMDYQGTHSNDVEPLLSHEDAQALWNGATQWGAINDQDNAEARNNFAEVVGGDVDSIDPVAVAEELDRRHEARHARLMAVVNTTLATMSWQGQSAVEQYVHTNIRSRLDGDNFDNDGYVRAYPEQYRESLRFRLLPTEEQKRLFFGAHPELDPANREDRSKGSIGFVARPLPDGTQFIELDDK